MQILKEQTPVAAATVTPVMGRAAETSAETAAAVAENIALDHLAEAAAAAATQDNPAAALAEFAEPAAAVAPVVSRAAETAAETAVETAAKTAVETAAAAAVASQDTAVAETPGDAELQKLVLQSTRTSEHWEHVRVAVGIDALLQEAEVAVIAITAAHSAAAFIPDLSYCFLQEERASKRPRT